MMKRKTKKIIKSLSDVINLILMALVTAIGFITFGILFMAYSLSDNSFLLYLCCVWVAFMVAACGYAYFKTALDTQEKEKRGRLKW